MKNDFENNILTETYLFQWQYLPRIGSERMHFAVLFSN